MEIEQGGVAPALRAGDGGSSRGLMVFTGGVASPLTASGGHHGHSSPRGDGSDNLVYAIEDTTAKMSGGPEVGLGIRQDVMYTLGSDPAHAPRGVVRRLTPKECERLQGFDDDWTAGQADSHRYRQIGNAVAVPVVNWIARRIRDST